MKLSLFQGILLGVFGISALLGLFVFATYSNTGSGGAAQIGSVVIWGTLPKANMDAFLTSAVRSNQALKEVSYTQVDPTNFKNNLTSAIATGAAPDLVLISQEQLGSLSNVLTPISPTTLPQSTFNSTFAAEDELFAAPNGGFYGVPFLIDPLVLYENRTILSSTGVAQPPSTWEGLTGLVPHIATVTSTGRISRALIALGTYSNITNARGILSALFLQTGVPISVRASTGQLSANLGAQTSAGGVPAGQAVLRFYTQFADPSKVSYTWNSALTNSQQAFLQGDLALYVGYASEARYFAQANPNLDFDIAPLPQPATATAKSTYGLAYAFATPRGATNASGGYAAAAALTATTPQEQAALATGLAPATRSALGAAPGDPTLSVAYASALYAHGWLSPAPADTDSVFSSMITSVISGRSTLDLALSSAQSALSALLQQ